jgi:hypothetical protein
VINHYYVIYPKNVPLFLDSAELILNKCHLHLPSRTTTACCLLRLKQRARRTDRFGSKRRDIDQITVVETCA